MKLGMEFIMELILDFIFSWFLVPRLDASIVSN